MFQFLVFVFVSPVVSVFFVFVFCVVFWGEGGYGLTFLSALWGASFSCLHVVACLCLALFLLFWHVFALF